MSILAFNIPHILDDITKDLTHWELFNCTLVSKLWNRVFNPVLWKELYTYYSEPECCEEWNYYSYFTTLESQRGLLKNCSDIRILKVRNSNVLRKLCATQCRNLVEIHYTPDRSLSGNLGLDSLLDLMEYNPNVKALALKRIILGDENHEQEVKEFLEYLCLHCPTVASIDFRFVLNISFYMEAFILINLLKHKHDITLYLSSLYNRAPSTTISEKIHQLVKATGEDSFEVRNLDLQLPYRHYARSLMTNLLGKCTKLQSLSLHWTMTTPSVWVSTLKWDTFTELQHLNISWCLSESAWEKILKSCQPLVSLILGCKVYEQPQSTSSYHRKAMPPSIFQCLSRHYGTLKYLDIKARNPGTGGDLSILAWCPNLETFRYVHVYSTPSDIMKMPDWTCLGLRNLRIEVIFDDRGMSGVGIAEDQIDIWIKNVSRARLRLLEQIGRLTQLQTLRINGNNMGCFDNHRLGFRPYIPITDLGHSLDYLGLGQGLELLSELKNLAKFEIDGFLEAFTCDDIDWMTEHWPCLKDLTQTIYSPTLLPEELKSKMDSNDITKNSSWVTELKRKRPRLKIAIYRNSRCQRVGPAYDGGWSSGCRFECEDSRKFWEDLYYEYFMNRVELHEDKCSSYIYSSNSKSWYLQ